MGQEPNPQRGAVAVTVGGRRAVLVANLGRLAALEEAWGTGISGLGGIVLDNPGVRHMLPALEILSGGELDRAFLDTLDLHALNGSYSAVRKCIILSFTGGEDPDDADVEGDDDPENPPTT